MKKSKSIKSPKKSNNLSRLLLRIHLALASSAAVTAVPASAHAYDGAQFAASLRAALTASTLKPDEKVRHVLDRLTFGATDRDANRILNHSKGVNEGIIEFVRGQLEVDNSRDPSSDPKENPFVRAELKKFPACAGNAEAFVYRARNYRSYPSSADYKPKRNQVCLLQSMNEGEFATYWETLTIPSSACSRLQSKPMKKDWTGASGPTDYARNYTECGRAVSAQGSRTEPEYREYLIQQFSLQRNRFAETLQEIQGQGLYQAAYVRLLMATHSNYQFRERMRQIDFSHFNVDYNKVRHWIITYERIFKEQSFGSFEGMLIRSASHAAMLNYLDNRQNLYGRTKLQEGLNENYAREVMELHTVGPFLSEYGANLAASGKSYTQKELRDLARILSGWSYDSFGNFVFAKASHDGMNDKLLSSPIFGRNLNVRKVGPCKSADRLANEPVVDCTDRVNDGLNALAMLARSGATAHRVAEKILDVLVYDRSPTTGSALQAYRALRNKVAATFRTAALDPNRQDQQLLDTYAEVLASPTFWSKAAYRSKARTPLQFVVATARWLPMPKHTLAPCNSGHANCAFNYADYIASATDNAKLYNRALRMTDRAGEVMFRYAFPTGVSYRNPAWANEQGLMAKSQFLHQSGVLPTYCSRTDACPILMTIGPPSGDDLLSHSPLDYRAIRTIGESMIGVRPTRTTAMQVRNMIKRAHSSVSPFFIGVPDRSRDRKVRSNAMALTLSGLLLSPEFQTY